jgi:hypothetical protein
VRSATATDDSRAVLVAPPARRALATGPRGVPDAVARASAARRASTRLRSACCSGSRSLSSASTGVARKIEL